MGRHRGSSEKSRHWFFVRFTGQAGRSNCFGSYMRHGLFDEISPMLHSSRTMRLLRILLVLVVTTGSPALAQTNAPEVRKLSLADCIAIAVQHNFDVQIRRYDPELARFTLSSQYGVY